MEKSNLEKAKELFIYAPLGAAGFVKDNAPTFFSMFVSRGKRDVAQKGFNPDENLTDEAQARGEEIAQNVVVGATKVIDFVENSIRSVADKLEVKDPSDTDQNNSSQNFNDSVDISKEEVEAAFAPSMNKLLDGYENLSAPEIIDKLDDYSQEELQIVLDHEMNFRNRQTIVHAIGYRLKTQNMN